MLPTTSVTLTGALTLQCVVCVFCQPPGLKTETLPEELIGFCWKAIRDLLSSNIQHGIMAVMTASTQN